MKSNNLTALCAALAIALGGASMNAAAVAYAQCPGDNNGDAIPDGPPNPNVKCMHLTAGDGFVTMADGKLLYTFGFNDVTGVPEANAINTGLLGANFPAPTIVLKEKQNFYLTLTNVGMVMRPDLFDPHTVHFHGFPNASSIFDGVPDASISINAGASLTYFYNLVEPGTYMYHCHVEATEHMQMGMLGNLYVLPAQDDLPVGTTFSNGFVHQAGYKYVYNDGDGSTYYDVEYPIQIGSFDPDFHDASINVQPLPFANMRDRYPMLNGRGYPDTVDPNPLPPPADNVNNGKQSQPITALITATSGQKILLRISNLNVTNFYTLTAAGLNMRVVGTGARQMRGPGGTNTDFDTMSVTVGGGEAVDVIIDTLSVPTGNYFLYTTNLNFLSNDAEDFGGMMTEIRINPAI